METTKQQGTTLAVLAPYLPYGIEVECGIGRGKVIALELVTELAKPIITIRPNNEPEAFGGKVEYYALAYVTPVLYAFDDLCTPLADGTVPAVEVAKLLLKEANAPLDWASVTANEDEDRIEVVLPVRTLQYPWLLHIQPDYTITCYNSAGIEKEVTAWKAIDYLRSKHFAIGLQPHQYIRKA